MNIEKDDKKLDLTRIADIINSANPDIVGLQEIDCATQRTGKVDQLRELERLTGMKGFFCKTLNLQNGEYGIAVLTKLDTKSFHCELFSQYSDEPRGRIVLLVNKNGKDVRFINTHLGLKIDERKSQISELVNEKTDYTTILVGDFNEHPDTENYKLLTQYFKDAAVNVKNPQPTFPADNLKKRIDYIFLDTKTEWEILNCKNIPSTASDHIPIVCEIQL